MPAASNEEQGPVGKRAEGIKNTVKEAASAVKNAVGAGSTAEATGTERGSTDNKSSATSSILPDFQNQEGQSQIPVRDAETGAERIDQILQRPRRASRLEL